MIARLRLIAIVLLLSWAGGCCAPKELFSGIDRNCFCADWMNHYSCVSCCQDDCQHSGRVAPAGEVLVLGKHTVDEAPLE